MASAILMLVFLYAVAGALFGLLFVWRGIERVDPVSRDAAWTFRLLILPGVAALWPLLAVRWRRAIAVRTRP